VSHASEDCETFVDQLVDELGLTGVKVWYDRERMAVGDVNISKMNEGMRSSRCAVIIASHAYFAKLFTETEANTLIYLEMHDRARRIIPILYGMTRADMSHYNPILSTRTYIDFGDNSLPAIVTYITHAVFQDPDLENQEVKPGFRVLDHLDPSPFAPGDHNDPFDVLPEPNHVAGTRPNLKITWHTPGLMDGHPAIMWDIENLGPGRAADIGVFMPGLLIYRIKKLDVGERDTRKIRFDDRYAYYEFMKPPFQAITEASDVFGNTYRQYASANQFPKWGGHDAHFETTQLGHPYPVSQRIVEAPKDDRFYRTEAMDWGFPP
jgi:hypothetical protein